MKNKEKELKPYFETSVKPVRDQKKVDKKSTNYSIKLIRIAQILMDQYHDVGVPDLSR